MNSKSLLALLLASTLLGGCVLHVGDGGGDRDDRIARQETRNRDAISRLALGIAIDDARSQLGEPDFTDAATVAGREVRILRYRTHRVRADGDTTPDETTPLIFTAGVLTGIGEHAARAALNP